MESSYLNKFYDLTVIARKESGLLTLRRDDSTLPPRRARGIHFVLLYDLHDVTFPQRNPPLFGRIVVPNGSHPLHLHFVDVVDLDDEEKGGGHLLRSHAFQRW